MRFQYSLGSSLFLLSLLISVINATANPFQVVGTAECVDCEKNNLKTSEAFSGVGVTIDCMVMSNGKEVTQRVGASKLDEQGKFTISLPKDIILQDGHKLSLKGECYAQLDSKSCAVAHKSSDRGTKIVIVSDTTVGLKNKLALSSTSLLLCNSKADWTKWGRIGEKWMPKSPGGVSICNLCQAVKEREKCLDDNNCPH